MAATAPLGHPRAMSSSRLRTLGLALLLFACGQKAFALGGTELEHVARRLATELGTSLKPADFEAPVGRSTFGDTRDGQTWLLGDDGSDGLLVLSSVGMGHAFEPAEVPGHGGRLLRVPQLVVSVRRLGGGLEPSCGAAVLEMQLDPKTRLLHATGLRTLLWADQEEFPQACGELLRFAPQDDGLDALVFAIPVRERRENGEEPPLYLERATARLAPGAFLPVGEPEREPLERLPPDRPLLLDCHGVDDCEVVEREQDSRVGNAVVREISARLPEVRVLETGSGGGWTRVQLEGPRQQVDRFLSELQEDSRAGQVSAELVLRTGELARATIRFQAQP